MKRALAFLFQKEGEKISEEDFIYAQSVDMEWFSSDEAREVIDKALESGLIKVTETEIVANFDYESVDIPMGFEPSEDILEEKKRDIFPDLLNLRIKSSRFS